MVWASLVVDVPSVGLEAVANFLVECGSPGVVIEELGDRGTVTGYFESVAPTSKVHRYCGDLGLDGVAVTTHTLDDQNWAENWKLHSVPQELGHRLYIGTSWAWAPRPDQVAIEIDPGMAFGTGQHATTRGCLELIELETMHRRVDRALDLGTGSGILAIALAKLGAVDVIAIDNDPLACSIANQNIANNGCTATVSVAASLDEAPGPFDLIVANLFADILVDLAAALALRITPDGQIILAGFLQADAARVLGTYAKHGLTPHRVNTSDGWTIIGLSRGNG